MRTCTWPVQVSTSHVHACSPACMPAQGSCTHVLRRARQHKTRARMFFDVCQHKTHARMFSGVYVSTRLMHACSPACTSARATCTHVPRRARQHKARARMFFDVHVSTRLVHACSPACMSAQGTCTHAELCTCVHAGGPRTQGVRAIRRPEFLASAGPGRERESARPGTVVLNPPPPAAAKLT